LLPKKERLSREREIKDVLQARQYESKSPLLHLAARDNQLPNSRLAIVTPGKLGIATTRNRLRRVFVAAYCKIRHKIAKNIDFVIFPRHASVGVSTDRAAEEVLKALRRAGITRNEQIF
jgi:ribonuclease P protein component